MNRLNAALCLVLVFGACAGSASQSTDAASQSTDARVDADSKTTDAKTDPLCDPVAPMIVDPGDQSGWSSSVFVDAQDKVHISYYGERKLKYATNVSGSWVISTAHSETMRLANTSLFVDDAGHAHISDAGGHLNYTTNISGSWVTSRVTQGLGAHHSSIAIDAAGLVHISFQEAIEDILQYASNATGAWVVSTIDDDGLNVGESNSLGIDSAGHIHISYNAKLTNVTARTLRYATNKSGTWVLETIDNPTMPGLYAASALALDAAGNVHLSYGTAEANLSLKYATNSSGAWEISHMDWPFGPKGISIAIDRANVAHLAFRTNDDLVYATNASGQWVGSTIEEDRDIDGTPSIGVDSKGRAHISYHDFTNQNLKYAAVCP